MERITGFMTPRNRQATVALTDEGDEDRPVTGRVAITEAVAPRGTAEGAPGHGEGTEDNLGAAVAALGREIREEESPTSLPDEEATMIAFEMLPSDVQDAGMQQLLDPAPALADSAVQVGKMKDVFSRVIKQLAATQGVHHRLLTGRIFCGSSLTV